MRISIVIPDNVVVIDGVARQVDCSGVEPDLHAVQWYGKHGEVEYAGAKRRNVIITDLEPYASLITQWEQWTPPPPGIPTAPTVVSRFQAKAALHQAGLLEQIQALMADPATPFLTRLAWEEAQEFSLDSPALQAAAAALGIDAESLSMFFVSAATIKV